MVFGESKIKNVLLCKAVGNFKELVKLTIH